jgi:hypothetical protein
VAAGAVPAVPAAAADVVRAAAVAGVVRPAAAQQVAIAVPEVRADALP